MYKGKTVAVIVPCYNEGTQIDKVLGTMPAYVDCIIAVDDASTDDTAEVIRRRLAAAEEGRIVLVQLPHNGGPGAAIAAGFRQSLRRRMDITAVMDGDGQMDPRQLRLLVDTVASGRADYAKANRLFYRRAWAMMPWKRYLGNAFLSMLTKIASGYWHVADSQTGFTAIGLRALRRLELDGLYPRYGYPNDMLVRLNVAGARVADVPLRPMYNVGEQSKMRLWKVIPAIGLLIGLRFFWRMWRRYVIQDFHPLVLFYSGGVALGLIGLLAFLRMVALWCLTGRIPQMNALLWVFCSVSAANFVLFGMWFDMQMNRRLCARAKVPRRRKTRRKGLGADVPGSE
jgi:glycosyltransferase involved in cell wall biosynthesis